MSYLKYFYALLIPLSLFSQINKDGDFQFWNLDYLEKKFSSNTGIKLQTALRLGDNASKAYLMYAQGLYYYGWKPLEFALGYRQLYVRSDQRPWEPICSPMATLTFKKEYKKIKFFNRNQVQYLIHKDRHRWLYRNKLRFDTKTKPFSFFAADEVFFLESIGLSQNRAFAGIQFNQYETIKISALYMIRYQNLNGWKRHNIIGLYLYFYF